MEKIWVGIPTYWTNLARKGPFDHPTPLDGISPLPRLLRSLSQQISIDFELLILVGGVDETILEHASQAIRTLIEPFTKNLSIRLCDQSFLTELRTRIDLPANAFNLTSYAGIRNLQLLIPHQAGAEIVVGLDDDEDVSQDYVSRIPLIMANRNIADRILGLAGIYVDHKNQYKLKTKEKTGNIFHDKAHFMNEGLHSLIEDRRPILPTPFVFGGNMSIHRDLFTQVGFDPGITRGEDIDYLINARIAGIIWWLAPDLQIVHLPPKQHNITAYAKLKQDVIRFIYERAKLKKYNIDHSEFDPYPGRFFYNDLDEHALSALTDLETQDQSKIHGTPKQIVKTALAKTEDRLSEYHTFAEMWPQIMTHAAAVSYLPGIFYP